MKPTKLQSQNEPAIDSKMTEILSIYNNFTTNERTKALHEILNNSTPSELSFLSQLLQSKSKLNFMSLLPLEITEKLLFYLDHNSLLKASMVCKQWKQVCENDLIWKHLCLQHIEKKCYKCGWGLPLMSQYLREDYDSLDVDTAPAAIGCSKQRSIDEEPTKKKLKRTWKSLYLERSVVASNWKNLKFKQKALTGHSQIVNSLYYNELSNVLISGSDDHTLIKWDLLGFKQLGVMRGHTGRITGCQFDYSKIISCSTDSTIRIWNFNTLECMRIINGNYYLQGRMGNLQCIHFVDRLLAVGSQDGLIKVWDMELSRTYNLQGHTSAVTKVWIIPGKELLLSCSQDSTMVLIID